MCNGCCAPICVNTCEVSTFSLWVCVHLMSLHSHVCACRIPQNKNNNSLETTAVTAITATTENNHCRYTLQQMAGVCGTSHALPGWLILAAIQRRTRQASNQLLTGVTLQLCVQPVPTHILWAQTAISRVSARGDWTALMCVCL